MKNLKQRFCEHFNCPGEEFERQLWLKCVHRRALPLAALALVLNANFLQADFQILRHLGAQNSRRNILADLQDLRSEYRRLNSWSLLRRLAAVRISGRRLLALLAEVWPAAPESPASLSAPTRPPP